MPQLTVANNGQGVPMGQPVNQGNGFNQYYGQQPNGNTAPYLNQNGGYQTKGQSSDQIYM